jgi:hypothetical protein
MASLILYGQGLLAWMWLLQFCNSVEILFPATRKILRRSLFCVRSKVTWGNS